MLSIERADLADPAVLNLIAELNDELRRQYPEPGANHFRLDPDEVAPGRGVILVARLGDPGELVGCGAIRLLEPGTAEVKRMFTRPTARGRGVARAMLAALEAEALALAATRLVLETGERQIEALALYQKQSFVRIPLFGEYIDSPLSICMEKRL